MEGKSLQKLNEEHIKNEIHEEFLAVLGSSQFDLQLMIDSAFEHVANASAVKNDGTYNATDIEVAVRRTISEALEELTEIREANV